MPVPVVVEFVAGTAGLVAGIGKVRTEMDAMTRSNSVSTERMAAAGVAASAVMVAAAGFVAVKAVEMAGDFQSAIVHLTTDAGEAKSNMGLISDGILDIARTTGIGTKDLINAMYYIESSGLHGAKALDALHASAEGAAVGNADVTVTANAVSTVLSAYGDHAGTATQITDQLVTAVSMGKTKLEDLSGAMATVLPAANTAGIGLDEILGAMATMTSQGQDAATSATYLRQTILQLENPTAKARKEMEGLGLDSFDVSSKLGQRGLTGTFDVLTEAIAKHTEGGAVLIESLKKTASSTTDFQQVLANLSPAQQTMIAALASMVGGTKSMQAALELTGSQAQRFKDDVAAVGASAKNTSADVQGMADIQDTFNNTMDRLKQAVDTAMISLGMKLLPVVTAVAAKFLDFTDWLRQHQAVLQALAITVGVVLVAAFITAGIALYSLLSPFLLAMSPILLVVGAIAALAAGFVYLLHNVEPVRIGFNYLMSTFKVFTDAFNTDPTAPFWDRVKSAFEAFWPVFKDAMSRLTESLWHWVSDAIPPFMVKIHEWGTTAVNWIKNTGYPMFTEALNNLANALIDWVQPKIPVIRDQIIHYATVIYDWLANTGLPMLGDALGTMGGALIAWILPRIPAILVALAELAGKIIWWIATVGVPDIEAGAVNLGAAIIEGIVKGIMSGIGAVLSAIGSLASRAVGAAAGALGGIGSSIAGAIGIPGFASGVNNFSGGLALVGENGPELVNLPGGSDVFSNQKSMAMSGGGGKDNGGVVLNVNFNGPVYGGPQGMHEVAQMIRTQLLQTKLRTGSLGLA